MGRARVIRVKRVSLCHSQRDLVAQEVGVMHQVSYSSSVSTFCRNEIKDKNYYFRFSAYNNSHAYIHPLIYYPLFQWRFGEPFYQGSHTFTPEMPQRLLDMSTAINNFLCKQFMCTLQQGYNLELLVNSLNGHGVHTIHLTVYINSFYFLFDLPPLMFTLFPTLISPYKSLES